MNQHSQAEDRIIRFGIFSLQIGSDGKAQAWNSRGASPAGSNISSIDINASDRGVGKIFAKREDFIPSGTTEGQQPQRAGAQLFRRKFEQPRISIWQGVIIWLKPTRNGPLRNPRQLSQ